LNQKEAIEIRLDMWSQCKLTNLLVSFDEFWQEEVTE
jgi:hypothetical protein